MNEATKIKVKQLFDEMFNSTMSESREKAVNEELDNLLIDPDWSDYIFFDDKYLNQDGSINYEKFFDKIDRYLSSDDYLRKTKMISLVNKLLKKDFTEIAETEIINKVNNLSPDINWMNYIFVDKLYLNSDGSLNEEKFLNKVFGA